MRTTLLALTLVALTACAVRADDQKWAWEPLIHKIFDDSTLESVAAAGNSLADALDSDKLLTGLEQHLPKRVKEEFAAVSHSIADVIDHSGLANVLIAIMEPALGGLIVGDRMVVRSVDTERNGYLFMTKGDVEAAIDKYAADDDTFTAKAARDAITFLPGVGAAAGTFVPLWRSVRTAGFVASCYGHNVESEAVRVKILQAVLGEHAEAIPSDNAHEAVAHLAEKIMERSMGKLAGRITNVLVPGGLVYDFTHNSDTVGAARAIFQPTAKTIPSTEWAQDKSAAAFMIGKNMKQQQQKIRNTLGRVGDLTGLFGGGGMGGMNMEDLMKRTRIGDLSKKAREAIERKKDGEDKDEL